MKGDPRSEGRTPTLKMLVDFVNSRSQSYDVVMQDGFRPTTESGNPKHRVGAAQSSPQALS